MNFTEDMIFLAALYKLDECKFLLESAITTKVPIFFIIDTETGSAFQLETKHLSKILSVVPKKAEIVLKMAKLGNHLPPQQRTLGYSQWIGLEEILTYKSMAEEVFKMQPTQSSEISLHETERSTMLKMILGMAKLY